MNKLFLFSLFLLSGATHAMHQNTQSPDQQALFAQRNREVALMLTELYGIKTGAAFVAITHMFGNKK